MPMYYKLVTALKVHTRYIFNLGATFMSQAISALSVLILTPVLLHSLGTADFAVYGILLNAIVFSTVFDFGLNMGLLKKVIENRTGQNELINTVFFFFSGFLLFSIPLFYVLYLLGIIAIHGNAWMFTLLAAVLICQNVLILFFDVLIQTANKIFLARIIRVGKLLLELVLLLILSTYHSVVILLFASIIINLIYLGVLFYFSKKEVHYQLSFKYFSLPLLWQHFKYSCWYFFNSIAMALVFNTQVIMLNRFGDANSIAKYLLVTRFFDIIRIGIANFMAVLFPTLISIQASGNWVLIKRNFLLSLQRSGLLSFFAIGIVVILVKPYFLIWSKFNDAEIAHLFVAYGVFVFLIAIDNISATFLGALKFNKAPTIVSIVQGLLALILLYFLLPTMGVMGAVVSSIIALALTNLLFNPLYLLRMIHGKIAVNLQSDPS